jgi:hypothetical protein
MGDVRFWSGGDSTSYYVSVALRDTLEQLGAIPIQTEPEYVSGSGLLSPEYHDWRAELRVVAEEDADLVIFMIGANDARAGLSLDRYRAEVVAIMDGLERDGRYVVWIGQPNMADPERAQLIRQINDVFESEASQRPWVRYVDSWSITSNDEGSYAQFLAEGNGVEQQIRDDDGLHLTPAGGRRIADRVLMELLGLE